LWYYIGVVEICQYVDLLGRNPFEHWFGRLDGNVQARIVVFFDRLERGNDSAVKAVGAGVYELRMDFGPGYRVYFGKDGERLVILLGGGSKIRQQADIEAARSPGGNTRNESERDNGPHKELQ